MENKTQVIHFRPENPTYEDIVDAQVEVGKIMVDRYGFDKKTMIESYDSVAASMGFDGDATKTLQDLRSSERDLSERAKKVRKQIEANYFTKQFRNIAAGASEVGYGIAAGTVELASKLPEKKDFGGYEEMQEFAATLREIGQSSAEAYNVDPEIRETFWGKVAAAAPSLAAGMAVPATIYPMLYDEATKFSENTWGMKFSEMDDELQGKAEKTRLAYMLVGGAAERLGVEKIMGRALKTKTLPAFMEVLESAAVEGTTEAFQQRLLRGLSKYVEDSGVEVFEADTLPQMVEEFFTSDDFLVGATLGGGASVGRISYEKVYNKFLNPDNAATDVDWKAMNDLSDEEVRATVLSQTDNEEIAELAVQAKNGDKEAQKAYVDAHYYEEGELGDFEGVMSKKDKELAVSEAQREQKTVEQEQAEQAKAEEDNRIRMEAFDAGMAIIDALGQEDVVIDQDDTRAVTFMEKVDQIAKDRKMDANEKDAYITDVLTSAASNMGITLEEARTKIGNFRITGETTQQFVEDVLTYRVQLNQGADLDTLYEEMGHVEYRRLKADLNTESNPNAAYEKVLGWKKVIEADTGEVTHGDTEQDVDEWLARKGVAWAIRNHQNQDAMGKLDSKIRAWIKRFIEKLKSVFKDIELLNRLESEGKLDPEMRAFMDRAIGINAGTRVEANQQDVLDEDVQYQVTIDERGGNPNTELIAREYMEQAGINKPLRMRYVKPDIAYLQKVADFMEATPSDLDAEGVRESYTALANETKAQYEIMKKNGIKIEPFTGKGEPYANSQEMMADVRDNKHLWFFTTEEGFGSGSQADPSHPLLQKTGVVINGYELVFNDLFRAVHDYFGHTKGNFQFGPAGEYNAFLAHADMFTDAAVPALAAETLAQNAWVNYGKHIRRKDGTMPKKGDIDYTHVTDRPFADQKTFIVPQILLPDDLISYESPSSFQVVQNQQDLTFYSQLERVLEQKLQGRSASVQQVQGLLSPKHGVKPEEVKWSGIEQWLEDNAENGKVQKDALMAYLRDAGRVRFEEVTMGAPSTKTFTHNSFVLRGRDDGIIWAQGDAISAERWRQRAEEDPIEAEKYIIEPYVEERLEDEGDTQYGQYVLPNGENYREVVLTMPEKEDRPRRVDAMDDPENATASEYTSSHFEDIPNYVAHMRLNERTDAEGNDGLFIEEIQSDRHQQGREKGYKEDQQPILDNFRKIADEAEVEIVERKFLGGSIQEYRARSGDFVGANAATPESARQGLYSKLVASSDMTQGIPDAPFRKDWPLQMFKRALRDAVASGKDWIGWTVGETQAERYDLSKQVDRIVVSNAGFTDVTEYRVRAYDAEGNQIISESGLSEQRLSDTIGKELASRAIEQGAKDSPVEMKGEDLKVGGEGMKGFYDNMLPKAVQKYVKRWGAKVEMGGLAGIDKEYLDFDDYAQRRGFRRALTDTEKSEVRKDYDAYLDSLKSRPDTPIHKVAITDAMRKSVQQGQPSYQIEDASHWSNFEGLDTLDPSKHGTGISGIEGKRKAAHPEIYVDRIYIGIDPYDKEPRLPDNVYKMKIDTDLLYDMQDDPERLMSDAGKGSSGPDETFTRFESIVKGRGYLGILNSDTGVVAVFYEIPTNQPITREWWSEERQSLGLDPFNPKVVFSKKTFASNVVKELERVKATGFRESNGATFNKDGTSYTGGGIIVGVQSDNTFIPTLTEQSVASFASKHAAKLQSPIAKTGIFKFEKSNQGSQDLGIVLPSYMEKEALQLATYLRQNSAYNMDSGELIETGFDGNDPRKVSDEEFLMIASEYENEAKGNEPESPVFQLTYTDDTFGYTYEYDVTSERFADLEQKGFITRNKSINDFKGKYIVLHQPDGAFSGTISRDGEILVEGKGGVYYPIRFHEENYFWASTLNAATTITSVLNEANSINGGTIYMALTSAPVDKLLSSTTMSNAVLDFFLNKANDRKVKIAKPEVIQAIIDAANLTKIDQNGDKIGLGLNLKKSHGDEKNIEAIKKALGPDQSSFKSRKLFSTELIGNVVKLVNKSDQAVNQFGEFFSSGIMNEFFKGKKKKGFKVSKTNAVQAISTMLSEPMTRGFQGQARNGNIYAIIEVSGPVESIASDKHESYPYAIVPTEKSKVKIHILTDAMNWTDVIEDPETGAAVEADRMRKIYPSTGLSNEPLKVIEPADPAFQITEESPEDQRQRKLDELSQKLIKEEQRRLAAIKRLHEQGEDVTDKLEQLDQIRKTLPSAIRARLGGDVQISRRKTKAGRQSELNRRTQRARELEQAYEATQKKQWLRKTLKRFQKTGKRRQDQSKELTKEKRNLLEVAARSANAQTPEQVFNSSYRKPNGMTQEQFEQTVIDFVGLLEPSNRNAGKIEAAYYAVKDIIREGQYEMDRFRAERKQQFEDATEEINASVLAGDKAMNREKLDQAEDKMSLDKQLVRWVDNGMTGLTAGFENIVRRFDGEQGGPMWEFLYADEVDGVNAATDRKNEYLLEQGEFVADALASAFPDLVTKDGDPDIKAIVKELHKLEAIPDTAEETGIKYSSSEGDTVEFQPVSRSKAMSIWLILRQEGSHETFYTQHGIQDLDAFRRSLEEYIGPQGMSVIENVITPFYENAYFDLNETFRRVEGYDMDQVNNYFAFIREAGFSDQDIEDAISPFDAFTSNDSRASVDKGATKTRSTAATAPFRFISAMDSLTQSIAFNANYIGMAGLEKRLRWLNTDPAFKRAIEQKFGRTGLQQFRKAAESVIVGRIKVEGWGSRLLEGLRGVGVTSVLSLKPKIAMTQLTSGLAGVVEMDTTVWVDYVSKIIANPTKHWNILKETPAMKDRMSRGQSQEVLMELNKIGRLSLRNDALAKLETATRYSMAMIKMGDIVGASLSAGPVYFETYDRVLAETGDIVEAKRKANLAFSRSVNRSQQSPHLYARPQAYQNNAIMRALYQFRSSPIQYLSEEFMAIREWVASAKRDDWTPEQKAKVAKQSAKALLIYHVVLPQLFHAVNNALIGLWLDDEEKRIGYWQGALMSLVFGNFGSIPVYGDAIYSTVAKIADVDSFPVSVAPAGLQNVQRLPSNFSKLLEFGDLDTQLDGLARILDMTGVGASTVKGSIESAFELIDEGDPKEILEILGWSEWLFGED